MESLFGKPGFRMLGGWTRCEGFSRACLGKTSESCWRSDVVDRGYCAIVTFVCNDEVHWYGQVLESFRLVNGSAWVWRILCSVR
jgi:hypothetical protein